MANSTKAADQAAAEQEAAQAAADAPPAPPVTEAPPTYPPEPQVAKKDKPAEQVRLIPSDVWADALVFPTDEKDEDGNYVVATVTAPREGNVPFLVDVDKATDVISAAARHGFAVQKETVA